MDRNHWDNLAEATLCVVPCYNEALVLGDVLDALLEVFPNILCINDGSLDASGLIANERGIRLVTHALNIGQGGSLQTAFSIVQHEQQFAYVITFDADGQHNPLDAKRLLLKLHDSNLDIVFGSRFLNDSAQTIPWYKRLMLRSLVRINRLTTGVELSDAHNGLRAIRVSALPHLQLSHFGMAHATEIVSKTLQANLHYGEASTEIRYTEYSKKKGQSIFNSVNILFDFLWR